MENNDIVNVLGKLLEDPETLSRLMTVAGGIMEGMKLEGQSEKSDNDSSLSNEEKGFVQPDEATVQPVKDNTADTAKLLASLLGGIKPKANDPRCALLYALKPYLSSQRAEHIDTLVKALGVTELASGFLSGSGLF